ncbi:unnamed protein product [Alternaria alternata]
MSHHSAEELAFKAEHDAITSYEEGWDDWDGPQWPIGTIQCSIQAQWTGVSPRQNVTDTTEDQHPMSGSGSGPTNDEGPSKKVTGV